MLSSDDSTQWRAYLRKVIRVNEREKWPRANEEEILRKLLEPIFLPTDHPPPVQGEHKVFSCGLPRSVLSDPEKPKEGTYETVDLYLSGYGRLVTITCDWYVRPEILEQIKRILAENGYEYIPFAIFGGPERFTVGLQVDDEDTDGADLFMRLFEV